MLIYGRSTQSIAEGIHKSTKEAQEIVDSFYTAFPTVKQWSDKTVADAQKCGYVETWGGRRRYIKNIQLQPYTFEYVDNRPQNFNPLSFDSGEEYSTEVPEDIQDYYLKKLRGCKWYKEKESIKQEALHEGIKIHDNGKYLAEAIRQCVNSRIQGKPNRLTALIH